MPSKVYFANFRTRSVKDNKPNKIKRLFDAAGFASLLNPGAFTALKVHFGERGTDAYLHPVLVRAVVDKVREADAKPFLTDTNTLYGGKRHNGVDHLETAELHGFTFSVVNAPVLIADGLLGDSVKEAPVSGTRHFDRVKLAGAIVNADAMLVLSHFKGHQGAGFGGAIKNLAMGCAPGVGKMEQHSVRFFVQEEKCTACGMCEAVCPEGAAGLQDAVAVINKDLCIGCGECMAHCQAKAVQVDWKSDLPPFMERMTEYALGASQVAGGAVGYMNFLMNITPDCDCVPWSDTPITPDIGILASTDPVAIDQASFDLVNKQLGLQGTQLEHNLECGEDKFKALWPHTMGNIPLEYGESIGLGSREYELVEM